MYFVLLGCSTEYALEAASLHPAKCIGVSHKKGTLNYGADADFVFLDDQLHIWSTWIAGECVYESSSTEVPRHSSDWK